MTTFFERINPLLIVQNHFGTFYNDRSQKLDKIEIGLWILLPFSLAFYIVFCIKLEISVSFANILLNTFAILGGFFINALVLLATKKEILGEDHNSSERKKLLKETFYNTSFGILVCVLSVVFCAVYGMLDVTKFSFIKIVLNIFIYTACFYFLLTLLVVLKRLNRILLDDLS